MAADKAKAAMEMLKIILTAGSLHRRGDGGLAVRPNLGGDPAIEPRKALPAQSNLLARLLEIVQPQGSRDGAEAWTSLSPVVRSLSGRPDRRPS
jgi:hypothetical protein